MHAATHSNQEQFYLNVMSKSDESSICRRLTSSPPSTSGPSSAATTADSRSQSAAPRSGGRCMPGKREAQRPAKRRSPKSRSHAASAPAPGPSACALPAAGAAAAAAAAAAAPAAAPLLCWRERLGGRPPSLGAAPCPPACAGGGRLPLLDAFCLKSACRKSCTWRGVLIALQECVATRDCSPTAPRALTLPPSLPAIWPAIPLLSLA